MPQSVAEKIVCSECGSDGLEKALFCYSCGAPLNVDVSSGGDGPNEVAAEESTAAEDQPISAPEGDPFSGPDGPAEESEGDPKTSAAAPFPPIKTAAVLKKDSGLMRMRRIEVRWTSDDGTPNIWFILATIVLFSIAFGVFLLSMLLR